jgi:hypothetical protein
MPQGGQHRPFLLEAEQGIQVVVACQHDLGGDGSAGLGVYRLEHPTHATCAQLSYQLVSPA